MRFRPLLLAAVALLALSCAADAQTLVTPRAGDTVTVVTGGTAVTIITGPVNGCYVVNPLTTTDEGIGATEPAYINPVTTATTTGNGTNQAVPAGGTWNCIPGSSLPVSANAATSGHKLVVVRW